MYRPFSVIAVLPGQPPRFIPRAAPVNPEQILRLPADRSTTSDEIAYSTQHTGNG